MGRKRKYHTEKERREAQRKWQMEHYQRNKEEIPKYEEGVIDKFDVEDVDYEEVPEDDATYVDKINRGIIEYDEIVTGKQ